MGQGKRDLEADPAGRRRFLSGVITTIHAAIGGTLAIVLGRSILSPSFARRQASWLPAGPLSDLIDNEPTAVMLRRAREDGYAQIVDRQVVFLVKSTGTGGEPQVVALSSVCTHLGCRVSWDAEREELRCPCHGGIFDRAGAVKDGPPPAPLARLQARIDGEQVLVQL
jgi:menaquinol-cytochrome c reductase iron-sulfur subunit